jgi:hypothetical protein
MTLYAIIPANCQDHVSDTIWDQPALSPSAVAYNHAYNGQDEKSHLAEPDQTELTELLESFIQ